jgi:hypothetical protein
MLELTLRQERIKYAKFSGGHLRVNSDLIAGVLNKGDANAENKHPVPKRRTRVHRQLFESICRSWASRTSSHQTLQPSQLDLIIDQVRASALLFLLRAQKSSQLLNSLP